MRRRLQRRSQLVRVRTKAKIEIHAALMRRLIPKPAVSDLFGIKGGRWLEQVELRAAERETVEGLPGPGRLLRGRELARQVEIADKRTVADWKRTRRKERAPA